MPRTHYRKTAQLNWGLTDEQMKGMHVHHKIPRSKGGTDAPENLFVCSPSFHANAWHSGKYLMILNASDVARMGGLARQKKGLSKDGFLRMQKHGERLGCLCRDAGIGIFARSPEKRMEDARKAGKAGIKSTLAKTQIICVRLDSKVGLRASP